MRYGNGDCWVYVALALAMTAAIQSAPADPKAIADKLRWVFTNAAAVESAAMAGAIGDDADAPTLHPAVKTVFQLRPEELKTSQR